MSRPPTVLATRYVQPLREGGSLPAVVEDEVGDLWVVKFRGAGQGVRALLAELLAGEMARGLGLPVPELALVEVPEPFGRTEPDPEIQDILRASRGLNVGLRYLDGAFNFEPGAAGDLVAPDWAADVVWVDSLLTNPDRTHRNPNILVWRNRPWLIDHGAAVYVHHNWSRVDRAKMRTPFQPIGDHVLLGLAASVDDADVRMTEALEDGLLDNVVRTLPDALLTDPMAAGTDSDPDAERERYRSYLEARLEPPRAWVAEAERARVALRTSPPVRREARR